MTLRTLVRPTYTLPKYLNFSQNCCFWHLQHLKNCI